MILHGGISHSGTRVFPSQATAIPSDLQGHVRVPDIDHAEEDESASASVLVMSSWQPSYVLDPGGNYPAHTAAHTVVGAGADILDPIDAALDQPPELVADTDSDDEEVLQADGPRRTAHGG